MLWKNSDEVLSGFLSYLSILQYEIGFGMLEILSYLEGLLFLLGFLSSFVIPPHMLPKQDYFVYYEGLNSGTLLAYLHLSEWLRNVFTSINLSHPKHCKFLIRSQFWTSLLES